MILYSHPLFGEGLAHLLATDHGLEVRLVATDDLVAAESALTDQPPDVVILERTLPLQAIDLLRIAPNALLIDVGLDAGPSWTYRRDELSPQPDEILRAIRGRRPGRPGRRSAPAASAAAPRPATPAPAIR